MVKVVASSIASIVTVKQLQFSILGAAEGGTNKLFDTPARNSHLATGGEAPIATVQTLRKWRPFRDLAPPIVKIPSKMLWYSLIFKNPN